MQNTKRTRISKVKEAIFGKIFSIDEPVIKKTDQIGIFFYQKQMQGKKGN